MGQDAFFVAGGTVPPGAPSYVERAADRELVEALLAGEFCYVLNSRQMGKSSLAVRTIARLNEAGARTAFVDLTRLGATGADPERWYAGLLAETGRALGLRAEAMAYLRANPELPAPARLFGFLREEALSRIEGPVVLIVDEIDAVRSLPFPADDLFAGLRELWNARASDPALARLTVCLLGAALPGDLVVDPRRTPSTTIDRDQIRLDYPARHRVRLGSSPGSRYAAVADADEVVVFDVATGGRHARIALPHSTRGPWFPHVSHTGKGILLWNGARDRLVLIDPERGRVVRERGVGKLEVGLLYYDWDSPDDRYTLVVRDGPARLPETCRLDLQTLALSPIRLPTPAFPREVRFDRIGSFLAWIEAAPTGAWISVRRTGDLREVRRVATPDAGAKFTLSPRGTTLAVADGRTLAMGDVPSGRVRGSIPCPGGFADFEFSPDGRHLLIAPRRRMAEEYDVSSGKPRLVGTIPDTLFGGYVRNGRIFVQGDDVRLASIPRGRPTTEIRVPGTLFSGFVQGGDGRAWLLGPDGAFTFERDSPLAPRKVLSLAGATLDGSGRYELKWTERGATITDRGGRHRPLRLSKPAVGSFAADPAGDRIALALTPTAVGVLDVRTGSLLLKLPGLHGITAIAFSPDGRWIAAGDNDTTVMVWNSRTGQRAASASLGREHVNLLRFSDDSRRVAAGMFFGDLGILDLRAGRGHDLRGATQHIASLAWSHDGRRLAAGGTDDRVRLWDAVTGRVLGEIGTHDAPILGMWFTKDDRTLCSVDSGGTLKLWRTSDRL